jgi:ABC-type antimicrobial peptide transport system permease subunit
VFSLGYAWNELRRRLGRTLVTAFGLAAGVGLVMAIIGVSDGLTDAQNRVLSPLGTVGTDIIVTRTVAPTTSTSSSTSTSSGSTTTPAGNSGAPAGGAGAARTGGFFGAGAGVRGASSLNSSDTQALLNANSSVLTDLAKLGKPGTKFTHDFFVPGTLITFPSEAVTVVDKIANVSTATGALSLQAVHETGTVPDITDTVKTGGQTLKVTTKPPTLTAAQQTAERACIQKLFTAVSTGTNSTTTPAPGGFGGTGTGTGTGRTGTGTGRTGTGGGGGFAIRFAGNNPAFEKCLTPSQQSYINNVVVPEQTITRTLNPPTTNTETSTYTVGGVNPSSPNTGLVTKSQVTSGTWFTADPANEVLVNTAYASQKKLKAGGTLTINAKTYKIVGLVAPTLTGNISDIYFDLSTMQSLSTNASRVNEVLVSVKNAADVSSVAKAIKTALPGAQVLTSKSLANQVTGSLANAKKLASDLGGALAIVVLLAAFLIAALLTLSSVAKRVREIGTLRAIGWTRGEVVRQIVAETIGIGILGGVLGVGIGLIISAIVGGVGPGLSVTTTGLNVGASSVSSLIGQSTTATSQTIVHLTSPVHIGTVLVALGGAIVGGLLAGVIGGWRAARLAPAVALRDLG